MYLPTRIEIRNAIKYPQFIKDSFFEGYSVEGTQHGKIKEWSGGFSMVYCLVKGNEKWAFKVWHREISDNKERYKKISAHLKKSNLAYFSNFTYVENGLLIEGELIDTLRMEWIEGTKLTEYISYNLYDKLVLEKLAKDFLSMTKILHSFSISHGDLQHENIIIKPSGEIKLIDYDSICVPETDGEHDICRGHLGFQHPSRITAGWISSIKIDYFSELIIYLSIIAVIENPLLWDKYNVVLADDRLLFSQYDFLDWENSPLRKDLKLLSPRIDSLVKILDSYLASHLSLVPFYK
jgi:serine/threonine protein kinase